jgi:hypothetical protein
MPTDNETLQTLNTAINDAENEGNREFLASVLAPTLSFYRANGNIDDADRFLQKVARKPSPGTLTLERIELLGNRAIVQCVVTQDGKRFHNIRLFVRLDGKWKLLAWANEASL